MRKVLLDNEYTGSGATELLEIKPEDLTETVANTAQTFELRPAVEGQIFRTAGFHLKAGFENSQDVAFNSVTIKIGDEDDDDRALTAKQIAEQGATVLAAETPNSNALMPHAYQASKSVIITITPAGGKSHSDLDLGRIVVFGEFASYDQFLRS